MKRLYRRIETELEKKSPLTTIRKIHVDKDAREID